MALTPNDFTGPDQIRGRLAAFETRYNTIARPFDRKFTRADLPRTRSRAFGSAIPAPW